MTWIGYATFPGVENVVGAQYTRSYGITPGVAELRCAPQVDFIGTGGELDFIWTNGVNTITIPLYRCRVVKADIRTGQSGQVWTLTVQDRRWAWEFGEISGNYNVRYEDGTIDPDHQRTPQQLATLCLQAMGEDLFDVSALPNGTWPDIDWRHVNPAEALQSLCDDLGCRLVLRLDDTVQIVQLGVGAALPDDSPEYPIEEDSLSIDPPERPDQILVVGGPSRYECTFDLEPVGLEKNGEILPIKKLSYAPKQGWERAGTPPDFRGIDSANKISLSRELAKEAVYRWYRIVWYQGDEAPLYDGLANGIELPGSGRTIDSLRQILPLYDVRVSHYIDAADRGKVKDEPATVQGTFVGGGLSLVSNGPDNAQYAGDYTIDREHGIVKFSDYVWRLGQPSPSGTANPNNEDARLAYPAKLRLTVAVSIRDPKTWAWDCYERPLVYTSGNWGTGPRILRHDEIVLDYVGGKAVNQTDCDTEADYYLRAADQEYELKLPQRRTYEGLLPLDLDGAIQQLEWHVGEEGARTMAGRNNEFSVVVPPHPLRRLWEILRKGGLRRLRQISDQAQGLVDNLNNRYRRPLT